MKIKTKQKQLITKFFILFLLMQTILSPVLTVQAHDAVYIKAAINEKTLTYTSELVTDKHFWYNEAGHIEAKTGKFGSLKTQVDGSNYDLMGSLLLKDTDELDKMKKDELVGFDNATEGIITSAQSGSTTNPGLGATDDTMIFTFPAKSEGSFGGVNNASATDTDRAFEISNTLTSSLNGMLSMINSGRKYASVDELVKTSIYMRPTKEVTIGGVQCYEATVPNRYGNDVHILYVKDFTKTSTTGTEKLTSDTKELAMSNLFKYYPPADKNGNLYAYVWINNEKGNIPIGGKGSFSSFIWAMPKGYVGIAGINNAQPIVKNNFTFAKDWNGDTAFLTIQQLTFQANYAYKNLNITTENPVFEQALDPVSQIILNLLSGLFYGLRSLLGLYETQELVFNQGLRGSGMFNNGMMNTDWWAVVLRYHLIFQAIAWSLIIGAVVKMLIQMNLSTINPNVRISIMETAQKLLIVGFLLVSIIPLTQLMTSLNTSIVDIFATQVDWSDGTRIANHSNFIAGLIIEIVYFTISLYLNFVYIMRSIMIAILVASGPFFVVSMAFSIKGKGLFDGWAKELIANIFLQSFHAFAFAFMINVQASSRGIEQLAVAMALVPLTEFFKSMIFGQSGSFAVSQGKVMAKQAVATGTSIASNFTTQGKARQGKSETEHNGKEETGKELQEPNGREQVGRNSEKLQSMQQGQAQGQGQGVKAGKLAGAMGAIGVAAKEVGQQGLDIGVMGMKMASGMVLGDERMFTEGTRDLGRKIGEYKNTIGASFFNSEPEAPPVSSIVGNKDGDMSRPIVSKRLMARERGLEFVPQKDEGGTMLIKDRSRLNEQDRTSIETHERAFNNQSIDKSEYKSLNNINNVLMNDRGQITSIGYTKQGMQELGIRTDNKYKPKVGDHFGEQAYYFNRTSSDKVNDYILKPRTLQPLNDPEPTQSTPTNENLKGMKVS